MHQTRFKSIVTNITTAQKLMIIEENMLLQPFRM